MLAAVVTIGAHFARALVTMVNQVKAALDGDVHRPEMTDRDRVPNVGLIHLFYFLILLCIMTRVARVIVWIRLVTMWKVIVSWILIVHYVCLDCEERLSLRMPFVLLLFDELFHDIALAVETPKRLAN